MLFPLGALFAIAGVLPWTFLALGLMSYPGVLHRALMMQGFELAFVLGFLLTAMPGFTRGPRFRPFELIGAALLVAAVGASALAGRTAWAAASAALAIAWALAALLRRLVAQRVLPPEEFAFVGFGLLAGLAGTVWEALVRAGVVGEPIPYFAQRWVALGMVLSLVLGLGALLVPVFAGIEDPLAIPLVARAHERRPRRALYLGLVLLLAAAFALDALGRPALGAALRAAVATTMVLWVWKLPAPSGRRDHLSVGLRTAGGAVALGLWIAALLPGEALAGEHVVFVAGFGLLTMAIGTRVVVAHGKHPMDREARVLAWWKVGAVLLAALARAAAEFGGPEARTTLLGMAGALWSAAWLGWIWSAGPLILRPARAEMLVKIGGVAPGPQGGPRGARD